ncbi:pyridoxamine 5'-phosphate oxidase family protein [Candidatus Sulfurimonas marisnigri]|uniref:Pyridoxamine 5'-phosphate oxidase family protein n=1 Tax=Candidatus Sulfurimonas marisnigri TaxID=2740405 RepID=A0A7S7M1T4_9BACT|nr:pyridoxamine 5'-phosphate oxidase family protein [Candidatus Sulfurimonas marisnigri]QOY55463.1 pyridoxamine 5'-phosphate oxidase family protein [Candidatus Sulfurimonas marisnigri]
MKNFISNIKTAVIATIDSNNNPFSSYAPYIYDNNHFYIYISNIATHAKNIQANPNASLFFIEDESKTENLFARKRISLQCKSSIIQRDAERFEEVFALYNEKFDTSMVEMLKKMKDFNLFELEVKAGEATFGFGEAYLIGGENMNELVARTGGSGHHGGNK